MLLVRFPVLLPLVLSVGTLTEIKKRVILMTGGKLQATSQNLFR